MARVFQNPPLIFICYAKEDTEAARKLYKRLKQEGFNPWLDEVDILPGQIWDFEINRNMKSADFILICLSKCSTSKRGYLNKEINLALDRFKEMPEEDIFLIPMKLEECDLPDRLSRFQAVNWFDDDGNERLFEALKSQDFHSESDLARVTANTLEKISDIACLIESMKQANFFSENIESLCQDTTEVFHELQEISQNIGYLKKDYLYNLKEALNHLDTLKTRVQNLEKLITER